ncbi:hypothetical protein EDC04DRAFT_2082632 [Pisolithus marmoratus]|nr:hypothetical protein EDC04DRAFT_2082632 [Pisolithus marmoratus]
MRYASLDGLVVYSQPARDVLSAIGHFCVLGFPCLNLAATGVGVVSEPINLLIYSSIDPISHWLIYSIVCAGTPMSLTIRG